MFSVWSEFSDASFVYHPSVQKANKKGIKKQKFK